MNEEEEKGDQIDILCTTWDVEAISISNLEIGVGESMMAFDGSTYGRVVTDRLPPLDSVEFDVACWSYVCPHWLNWNTTGGYVSMDQDSNSAAGTYTYGVQKWEDGVLTSYISYVVSIEE